MEFAPWLIIVGVGGFVVAKWMAQRQADLAPNYQSGIDPMAAAVDRTWRETDRATPTRSEPTSSTELEPAKVKPARLTLKQAERIRDRLTITEPSRLAMLYLMTRPEGEQESVLSFIQPQDGKPEEGKGDA